MRDHLLDHPFQKNIGCCVAHAAAPIACALTEKTKATGKIQKSSISEGNGVSLIVDLVLQPQRMMDVVQLQHQQRYKQSTVACEVLPCTQCDLF